MLGKIDGFMLLAVGGFPPHPALPVTKFHPALYLTKIGEILPHCYHPINYAARGVLLSIYLSVYPSIYLSLVCVYIYK